MHSHAERLALMHQHAAEREMKRRGLGGRRRRMYAKRRHPYGRGRRRARGAQQGPCRVKERKFHDGLYAADPVGTATAVLSHSAGATETMLKIAQGLTEDDRIGRRICVRAINVKGHLSLANGATAATGQNLARLWLVLDMQANGATPAATEVFETATAGIHSYRNLANQERFSILWTKLFVFNTSLAGNGTDLDTALGVKPFAMSKKTEFIVQYNAGTGAIEELDTANVFLMGASENSNAITLTARFRIRFTD